MPKPNGAGLIPTAVKLPEELWKRVRHRAIDEDRTASDVVRDAIELYLLDGKKAPR